jgi:hypothetical protein
MSAAGDVSAAHGMEIAMRFRQAFTAAVLCLTVPAVETARSTHRGGALRRDVTCRALR